jgi:hypothetical protein
MDRRFQDWETQLPAQLRWRRSSAPASPTLGGDPLKFTSETAATPEKHLFIQRHMLAGWYLCALMNLHRPYLMHAPPILPPPGSTAGPRNKIMLNPSRERCIEVALELARVMCAFHEELMTWREPGRPAGVVSYFLFDGAVALAGALSQSPPHPQASECLALMDKAMAALAELVQQAEGSSSGEGENAKRALVILRALRKAGGWDRKDEEKGELVLLQDMLLQARRAPLPQPQPPQQPQASSSSSMYPSDNGDFYPPTVPNSSTGSPHASFSGSALGGGPSAGTAPSPFIPYLNTAYPPYSGFSRATPGPLQPFPNMPPDFGDVDMTFAGVRAPMDMLRPSQSIVSPFDVLQGVQPEQTMEDLDLDWARLAGMESWYSGSTSA